MTTIEIFLNVLAFIGIFVSFSISEPMTKDLIKKGQRKTYWFFNMPYYLGDYRRMIREEEDFIKKKRYKHYYRTFLISFLGFILCGILFFLYGAFLS